MKRRDFIKHGGIAGVLAAGTAPAFAQGQEFKWRMTSSFPKSLDTLWGAAEFIAKRVGEITPLRQPLQELALSELPRDVHKKGDFATAFDARPLLAPAIEGQDMGLVSEAGMPAVADPGASVVRAAHDLGIKLENLKMVIFRGRRKIFRGMEGSLAEIGAAGSGSPSAQRMAGQAHVADRRIFERSEASAHKTRDPRAPAL